MKIQIRDATDQDLSALHGLTEQLGYPVDAPSLRRNLALLLADRFSLLRVAAADGESVGWVNARLNLNFESGSYVEILGLVVEQRMRGSGIGTLLIAEVERWAEHLDCPRIRVRSNVKRAAAHAFYQRLGYVESKRQVHFLKTLEPPKPSP